MARLPFRELLVVVAFGAAFFHFSIKFYLAEKDLYRFVTDFLIEILEIGIVSFLSLIEFSHLASSILIFLLKFPRISEV